MKKIILPLLLAFSFPARGQSLFIETFDSPAWGEVFTGITLSSSKQTFLTSGYTLDTVWTTSSSYTVRARPAIAELDTAGALLWARRWNIDPSTWGSVYLQAIDAGQSEIYASGHRLFPNLSPDVFVTRLDSAGQPIWIRQFGAAFSPAFAARIKALPQGGCVVAGYVNAVSWLAVLDAQGNCAWSKQFTDAAIFDLALSGNTILVSGNQNNAAFLARISLNGTLLWSRQYQVGTQIRAASVIETSGHRIACAGFIIDGGLPRVSLLQTDTNGNFLQAVYYTGLAHSESVSVCENPQQELLITGYANSMAQLFTLCVDTSGWPLVARTHNTNAEEKIAQALIGPDNRLYAAGYRGDSEFPLLIKTTPQGYFGCGGSSLLFSPVFKTGIVSAGDPFNTPWVDQPPLLQTTDTALTWTPQLCLSPDVTGIQEPAEASLGIFPVPAADRATLHLGTLAAERIELLDLSGKMLRVITVKPGVTQISVERGGLAGGIYLCRCADKYGRTLATGKIVFEK